MPSKKRTTKKKPVKKVTPPSVVKIGYQDFALLFEELNVDNAGHYGITHTVHSNIRVTNMGNAVEKINTLIHELLHAVFHTQGIKLDRDTEETVVNSTANGLTALIRDNPRLIHYILDQLEMI